MNMERSFLMKHYKKLILSALLFSLLWAAGCGAPEEASLFVEELLPRMQELFSPDEMEVLTRYAADQGYNLEEFLEKEYTGKDLSPEACLEYLALTIQEVKKSESAQSTPKDDAAKDVTTGNWVLQIYDPLQNSYEIYYQDGVMKRCDVSFSKSGDEEEREYYSYEEDQLDALPFYGMTPDEILVYLEEEEGYSIHNWKEVNS